MVARLRAGDTGLNKQTVWLYIWQTLALLYFIWLVVSDAGFDMLSVLITANLVMVPFLIRRHASRDYTRAPVRYVRFSYSAMRIGKLSIPINEIDTVIIDISAGEGYFSLDSMSSQSGNLPYFCFPASEYIGFRLYLKSNLPNHVIFKHYTGPDNAERPHLDGSMVGD